MKEFYKELIQSYSGAVQRVEGLILGLTEL